MHYQIVHRVRTLSCIPYPSWLSSTLTTPSVAPPYRPTRLQHTHIPRNNSLLDSSVKIRAICSPSCPVAHSRQNILLKKYILSYIHLGYSAALSTSLSGLVSFVGLSWDLIPWSATIPVRSHLHYLLPFVGIF